MSGFWVSQAKHYCKYCKVWTQGDKMSILKHEQGKKHQEIVAEFKKGKREDRWKKQKDESELQRQLREINQAAAQAVEQDIASGAISYSGPSSLHGSSAFGGKYGPKPPPAKKVPPPPPPRPSGSGGFGTKLTKEERERQEKEEREREGAQEEEPGEGQGDGDGEDNSGIYTVDGITYLDGKVHGQKLKKNTPCQVWLDDREEWYDGVIVSVKETAVPNTDLKIRACAVAFYLPEQLAAESTEPTILEELPSDRFRLIAADEDGTWEELDELGQPLKKVVPLDENTGLGGWETVAVVEIDEEAESAAREEAQRKAAKKKEEKKMRQEKLKEIEDHAQLDGDDAMSSYDPWGTGLYKGIALEDQATSGWKYEEGAAMATANAGKATFKKRKLNGANGKKKKLRKRAADEDE